MESRETLMNWFFGWLEIFHFSICWFDEKKQAYRPVFPRKTIIKDFLEVGVKFNQKAKKFRREDKA